MCNIRKDAWSFARRSFLCCADHAGHLASRSRWSSSQRSRHPSRGKEVENRRQFEIEDRAMRTKPWSSSSVRTYLPVCGMTCVVRWPHATALTSGHKDLSSWLCHFKCTTDTVILARWPCPPRIKRAFKSETKHHHLPTSATPLHSLNQPPYGLHCHVR